MTTYDEIVNGPIGRWVQGRTVDTERLVQELDRWADYFRTEPRTPATIIGKSYRRADDPDTLIRIDSVALEHITDRT